MKPKLHQPVLAALIVLICVPGEAGEVEAIVFPSGPNAHIYDDGPLEENAPRDLKIAPVFSDKVGTLGEGRVFDIRAVAERSGIELGPTEMILYCPSTELVFCKGTQDTRDLARVTFEGCDHSRMAYEFTLSAHTKTGVADGQKGHERQQWMLCRGAGVSGGRFVLRTQKELECELEFVAGPHGKELSVRVGGRIPLGDELVELSTSAVATEGEDLTVFQRPSETHSGATDSVVLRIEAKPNEEQRQHSLEWQKTKAAEVNAQITQLMSNKSEQDNR